jgi:phage terminase Nu1 subunit (DNA packaging protein)
MSSANGNHKLRPLLSTEELAEIMGEQANTVRRRRERGAPMPPGHQVAGRWVYCRRDVERWLHEQQQSRSSA